MGTLKEKMIEWMESQHLTQRDLNEMDPDVVDEQFNEWFNNSMKIKK